MRRFGDPDMWARRNAADPRTVAMAAPEIPLTSYDVTEGAGVSMSELTPLFLSNQGGEVMTSAKDYGTLYAAGRPG